VDDEKPADLLVQAPTKYELLSPQMEPKMFRSTALSAAWDGLTSSWQVVQKP
jgi:hypothetical protein